jgi:excisionase family DNA binding protein
MAEKTLSPLAYTIKDACRLLSISRSHLYDLAAQRKLRFVKVGARTLVPASEISRLLSGEAA